MPTSITILIRGVVVLSAVLAAILLVHRWAAHRRSCWITTGMLLLSVVPTVLMIIQTAGVSDLGALMGFVGALHEPGYALLLLSLILGLRRVSRTTDDLCQQNGALRRDAFIDFLTGLPNRRHAELLLSHGAAQARRNGGSLGFIMMDLDHFKEVNDRRGHQAGDAVLARVGRVLRDRLRDSDIVARYGGEEFLVVVPEPDAEGLITLADEIRRTIEREPAESDGLRIPMTASFGVAVVRIRDEKSVDEGIRQSDTALYVAKSRGGNCVARCEREFRVPEGPAEDREPAGDPLAAGRTG